MGLFLFVFVLCFLIVSLQLLGFFKKEKLWLLLWLKQNFHMLVNCLAAIIFIETDDI